MLTVNKLIAQGRGLARVLLERAAFVELDWDTRQKSRFDAVDSTGRSLGVFLPRGSAVRGGDVLVADDGSLVRVRAALQAVMVVRHCTQHGSAFDLLRAAYHLGNRHVALELRPDHLKLEPDHVLAEMLRRMHLIVADEQSAFEPEVGAYAESGQSHQSRAHGHADVASHGPSHGHPHACSHDHDHDHGHVHDHNRSGDLGHGHTHEHVHTHGHGHGPANDGHAHGNDHLHQSR